MPDERTYNVISGDKCFFESMTKEEILTAITQAVESHAIADVDTGFVQTIKEQNHGTGLKFWIGTTAEYNALQSIEQDVFYILTDDTELDDMEADIASFRSDLAGMGEIVSGLSDTVDTHTSEIADLTDSVTEMQTRNGFVFLDDENGIPFAYSFVIPIELDYIHGDNPIYIEDFSLVNVQINGGMKILCNVQSDMFNSIITITGNTTNDTGYWQIDGEEQDGGRTSIVSIYLTIEKATHRLIRQESVCMTHWKGQIDGTLTIQQNFFPITIKKIVGVM